MPTTAAPDPATEARLDDQFEREYEAALPPEHYMEATDHAEQRRITLASLALVRAARPDVHVFNELMILYPSAVGKKGRGGVVPDNFVVLHNGPLAPVNSYRVASQPAGPFLVIEYVSPHHESKDYTDNLRRYQDDLKAPYYLLFRHADGRLDLHRHDGVRYRPVPVNAAGRLAVPELELEAGLHDGYMRYWFRGELLPMPEELLQQVEAARGRVTAARDQLDAAQAARQALEAEVARLKAELAAKG